ncbi:MAG TPA: ATP-binding protein [Terracidiphilus sp.]|nr:ATP-binding protein [Terracidiphilus sp.]
MTILRNTDQVVEELLPEGLQPAQQTLSREFTFAGESASLAPARDAIMQVVHEYCADEQQEIDILLAVQEALANAILHGCQNDASKTVRCTVEVTPCAIQITVQDPGPGFNTGSATESTENGTNLTEHGRGIFMMRSLMDEVSYRRRGSEVVMKKLRAAAP